MRNEQQLQNDTPVKKDFLFVCQGNVGRSQMAEGYYNFFKRGTYAISAGIDDVAEKYNGHPTKEIIEVMLEEEISVAHQKIKQLSPEMITQAQNVVVLCNREICPDFLLKNPTTVMAEIEDPYQMTLDKTRTIRDQVKELIATLLNAQTGKR